MKNESIYNSILAGSDLGLLVLYRLLPDPRVDVPRARRRLPAVIDLFDLHAI